MQKRLIHLEFLQETLNKVLICDLSFKECSIINNIYLKGNVWKEN